MKRVGVALVWSAFLVALLSDPGAAQAPAPRDPNVPEALVTVSGTVVTEDDKPLEKSLVMVNTVGVYGGGTSASARTGADGRFSVRLRPGPIYVMGGAPGYAPTPLGPFAAKPGEKVENLRLVLGKGFAGRVQLADPDGKPITGARLTPQYGNPQWMNIQAPAVVSDDTGMATLDHCSKVTLQLEVEAGGYQWDRTQTELSAQKPFTWTLHPSKPVNGRVLSEETGKPIAGAVVKLMERYGFAPTSWLDPFPENFAPVLAKTDDKGWFQLTTLRDDSEYGLSISADGYGLMFFRNIKAGGKDIQCRLGPPRHIRVKLVGPPEKFPGPELAVRYCVLYDTDRQRYQHQERLSLDVQNGEARFEVPYVVPGTLMAEVGKKRVEARFSKPDEELVLDLSDKPTRAVEMRFNAPDGAPAVRGTVGVSFEPNDRTISSVDDHRRLEMKDGRVRFDVEAPGRLWIASQSTPGYWFETVYKDVLAGADAMVIEVPCLPARSITGEILDPDGRPLEPQPGESCNLRLFTVSRAPGVQTSFAEVGDGKLTEGKFAMPPAPLGGIYVVAVLCNGCFVLSEPVKLDEGTPAPQVLIRMVKGVTVPIQVLLPDGTPYAGVEVVIGYDTPYHHGFTLLQARTDREGRTALEHINPDAPGTYRLHVQSVRDYRPVRRKFNPAAGALTIRMESGKVLAGRVLDSESGKPVPGAHVVGVIKLDDGFDVADAEQPTDENGGFRFSNMGSGVYELSVVGMNIVGEQHATAGQEEPVELRVKPPRR